ncbi:uncharacterized protein A4U43_C08F20260 [Asparagus officinalis]|nr:uncharacterized protein A4U43_C08F20260 [Asparagus officinalis]
MTFIKDEKMLKRLMETNPNSFRKMMQMFLEASGRGYWETSEENLEKLRQLYSEVEDKIEGIDRRRIRNVGARLLPVLPEVFEHGVCGAEGHFEDLALLGHADAWSVTVKGKGFATKVHVLELFLVILGGIFDGKVNIRGVGVGGVGEDTGGRFAHRHTEFFS